MLEATGLTFSYGDGRRFSFPDLRCQPGAHWLVLGESGTGKTTFLHLLAGLRTPTAGSVMLNGTDLHRLPQGQVDRYRGSHIGLVFQTAHFLQALTLRQNLVLAQRLAGRPADPAAADALLGRLGLAHRADALPRHCSQGEQQRASIGRAVINGPTVVLADEPTSALDDRHCAEVISLLEEYSGSCGAALVIVTHDQRLKGRSFQTLTLERHA